MPKKNNAPASKPTCHPDRKHCGEGLCKECYDKEYCAKNRERLNAKSRAWAKRNPRRIKATKRKYNYGVDEATVQAIRNAQDDRCKICQVWPASDMDHNHATGTRRGLLCGDCNRALGLFRDDPVRIARAIIYLSLYD